MDTPTLQVIRADITTLTVDAIVNAANASLSGGAGVNGAIQRAAGPELLRACRQMGACATGDAVLTPGFGLPARFVIHAVGPVWQGGMSGEADLLASCYRCALQIAEANHVHSIAFPCISTGIYGFPAEQAARIAVEAVRQALPCSPSVRTVVFCCFSDADVRVYRALL